MAPFDNSQNFSAFFNGQGMKFFKNFQMPTMDLDAYTGMQRKNMDAFMKAQHALVEAMAIITKAQTEFLQTSLEMAAHYAKNMEINPSKPQEAFNANTKAMQEAAESLVKHGQDLAQMWSKSNEKIISTLSSHMDECMKEAQTLAKKATKL